MVPFISLLFFIAISSAQNENDYLDTKRNMQLLHEKPKIVRMPDFKSIFFPKQTKTGESFDFREENDDVFKTLEMALSDMSDVMLLSRMKEEEKKDGMVGSDGRDKELLLTDLAKCKNDSAVFMQSVQSNATWALKMMDSYGFPYGGLLEGDTKFYGTYDECLRVEAVVPSGNNFKGKYCLANLNPKGQTGPLATIRLTVGMCVPDSCDNAGANAVVKEYFQTFDVKYSANLRCQERDRPLDDKATVAIVVCSILVFLVVIGTAYDVIFCQILKDDETKLLDASRYGAMSKVRTASERQGLSNEKSPLMNSTSSVADSESVHLRPIYEEEEPALIARLLLSFSAYTNGAKILNTKQAKGSLTAVHGIRFLSMSWVILGHAYSAFLGVSAGSAVFLQNAVKRWTFHAIFNALVSVDSFFTMSGFLVTYLTLKELKRAKGDGRFWAGFWGKFYFHRFWRLTPIYMLCLMIHVCLYPYFYDGPRWGDVDCSETWWTNLLYINNLVERDRMCMGWSWYLANDMQFYVISPLILIPLAYFPVAGMIVWLVFMIGTMATAGIVTRVNKLPPGIYYSVDATDQGKYNDYYMTPYCRMGSYLAGMAAGYCLYRVNWTYKLKPIYALLGWCVAAASALAVLYGPYDAANGTPMSLDVSALYNAVHRAVWGAAVAWVVWACATGNGGYVNTLLSWSGFVPLSRLSYAAYLIHIIVQSVYTNSLRIVIHIDDINMMYLFLGLITMSYLVSFVVSLCFEVPMMGLEKILLKRDRKS